MQAAARWPGGEPAEVEGPMPRRRYRKGTPGRGRDRLAKRDAAVAILARLVEPPARPFTAIDIADAFGITRQHASALIARLRSGLEGGRDG